MVQRRKKITRSQLKEMAVKFGNLVKAVVDIEKGIIARGGELYVDEEALFLEKGFRQSCLWRINFKAYALNTGVSSVSKKSTSSDYLYHVHMPINFYPELQEDNFIEFDSVINLRPMHGNRRREIEDIKIREKNKEIVNSLVLL